jgi:hypothetical protein
LHCDPADFRVVAAKKFNAQDARAAALKRSRQILDRGEGFLFRAQQNVAGKQRRGISRASRFDLK